MSDPPLEGHVGDKLLALHAALDAAGIEHAFGGAIALAYAVEEPRATRDIDVNVTVGPHDIDRLLRTLPAAVDGGPDAAARLAATGQHRLRWGDIPVDLFLPQHEFHSVVAARASDKPFRDQLIPVVGATDLTVLKALFDRRKDWADIEAMLRAGAVDVPDALAWLERIVGADHPVHAELVALAVEVAGEPPGDVNVWRRPSR